MLDAYVPRTSEFLERQRVVLIGDMELFDTALDRPLWSELWQDPCDLVAVDTIAAKIGTATLCVFDPTARHDLLYHRGYVTDLVILFSPTDIECLVVNELSRGLKDSQERAANIFHVY